MSGKRELEADADEGGKRARVEAARNEYAGFRVPRRGWRPEVVDASMAPEEFYRRFVATRTPVVVRGHLRDAEWQGARWNDEHLKRRAGDARVMVERKGANGGFGSGQPKVAMRFGELLDRLAGGETGLYLTTQPEDEEEDEEDEEEVLEDEAAADGKPL
jgi:hypothetical protein